ncbi:LysM peptidoglycan-binding domain-containing protein [Sinomonas mesophila]|uniref:LysM peptidoglycan-binding domain-containing protein n=1 Tax=Sinomonas mesophila TaxID=1531955 RepID=UPI000984C352|nr:LysM domain-containing protein [Sinomonas mesophila]
MENTRRQQLAADGLVTAAVLALGATLVAAGRILAGDAAPGGRGDWLRMAPLILEDASPRTVTVLLGVAASVVGLVVVAWWLLAMALAVASALLHAAGAPGASRWAGAFAPAFMRRLALTTLGLSLVTAPAVHAATALPDPTWQPAPVSRLAVEPAVPEPTAVEPAVPEPVVPEAAWIPEAPPPATGPLVRQPMRAAAVPGAVEVRPGDSLWSIVARQLGPGATDLDIAEAWPRWYAANASVIGTDPDLVRPGQLLVPPP